jgi:hypothetical protein
MAYATKPILPGKIFTQSDSFSFLILIGIFMRIGRYSHTGFTPVFQSEMKSQVDYLLSFNRHTCGLSGHILENVDQGVRSRLKDFNPNFSFFGIHVFFVPIKVEDVELFLNHLAETPPYHEEDWDDDCLANTLSDPFSSPLMSLKYLKQKGHVGAYIPFLLETEHD